MARPPSAQEVADALAMTLEREDASGGLWSQPSDAVALRRWVSDRSASLGTGIRRVARLARLMAIADGRDYVRFLYTRLAALRARHFRSALEAAASEGVLRQAWQHYPIAVLVCASPRCCPKEDRTTPSRSISRRCRVWRRCWTSCTTPSDLRWLPICWPHFCSGACP